MVENITNVNENTNDFSNLINPYTNKPVQTGKSVSFNQRIYNDTNYIQAKNDLLNEFNTGMTKPSKNQQAIYDIPVVPEFLQEEYQQANQAANWLNSLNIATPEEIDEWRAKGKIGIGETMQKLASLKSAKYVPFVGTTADVGYNLDMLSTVNRLKKGEKVSQLEQDLLVDYLRELKEIQVRGTTLPSKALNAILESIPFMVEFGVGVAAAPETFGSSLSASAFALSKTAGKKAARKAVEKALKKAATESVMTGSKKALALSSAKQLYKTTYDDMVKSGAGKAIKEVGGKEAAKIIAKTTPESIIAANFGSKPLTYMTAKNTLGGITDRQLAGSFQITDAGDAIFLEPENIALSIMKSFGSSVFDNYTETMGWAFAPVTSYFARPLRKILPQKFFTEFDKLVSSRYGMPATKALKKYGYDGVIEEMGEELLNRFLCQTFGVNGLDEYTFDGFMNNVFYANNPEQWLVEALSFAIMGAGAHGFHGAVSKLKEELQKKNDTKAIEKLTELANKRLYSPAEFYLEQGLIKIEGSQSVAEQELRKKFAERGIDKNTVDEFIKASSELEIRNELKKFIDEDDADATKRREKAVNFLANKMLENKSYNDKKKAEKNANLFVTALEKLSETSGISIEKLIEDEAPKIQYQTSDINIENNQNNNVAETSFIDEYANSIFTEINNLPDDYQDTEYIEGRIKNADLALKIKSHELTDAEFEDANKFVNELDIAGEYSDLVAELRNTSDYVFETKEEYLQRTENNTDNPAEITKKDFASSLPEKSDTTLSGINNVKEFTPEEIFSNTNTDLSDSVQEDIKEQYTESDVISQEELDEYYNEIGQAQENEYTEEIEENDIELDEEKFANNEVKTISDNTNNEKTDTEVTQDIQDVGDSLLGNLKRNGKIYTWEELESMNDLLRTKYVAKKYIMPKPEIEELVKQGCSEKSAAFVINVYNRINAKPAKGYDKLSDYKIYFDSINDVMQKTLEFAQKEKDKIDNFKAGYAVDKSLFEIVYPDIDNKKPYNIFKAYPDYNKSAIITGGNKMVSAMYLCRDTEKDIEKILNKQNSSEKKENNEEKLTGWRTKFDIVEYFGTYRIAEKKSGQMFHYDFPNKEKAEYVAEKLYEAVKKERYGFTVSFTDMRDYIPHRENNQNVKPEALIEVFGFRGINFGNWTKQSERQDFVNLAYDSLYDLAELLNLPPKAMSLNGKLGLAFGAQGRSGKAAGHFIPEFNEINLTRKSGAGTLAHEWFHAMDWYFGDIANGKDFSGVASTTLSKGGELRPELFTAIQNLNKQIRFSPLTEDELEETRKNIEANIQRKLEYYGKDIKNNFKKIKEVEKLNALVDDIIAHPDVYLDDKKQSEAMKKFEELLPERRKTYDNVSRFSWIFSAVREYGRMESLIQSSMKESNYLKAAKKLDRIEKGMGVGYWSSKTEMTARAFSSYLLDKMQKREFKNSFLVRSQAGESSIDPVAFMDAINNGKDADSANIFVNWNVTNPEEKQRIFDAFDMLFKTIKYEETDKGYKLYQSADVAGVTSADELADAKKEWEEKGTESKYFKKWFGDSKVVDRFGNPISVFHGTENNFKIFKNLGKSRQIGANVGFFFTDNKNMAKQYANDKRVMEVYLSLQNPLIVEPNSTIKIFNEKIEIADTFDFFTQLDTKKSEQEIREELLKQGYDGIILRDTNVDTRSIEDVHDVYIAFENNQIKSVNNRGTFDAGNPNIYYQSAYHGSPHKFDEFSLDAIGTGEGAQAHGWGLYFAENKNVSEQYREKLTYGKYDKVLYNNKEITDTNTIYRLKKIYDTPFIGKKSVIEELNEAINGKQERINRYTDRKNLLEDNPVYTETDKKSLRKQYNGAIKNLKEEIEDLKEKIEFYNNVDADKIIIQHKTGQLFEVNIPDNDVLLDEEEILQEQPEKVKKIIDIIIKDYNIELPKDWDYTGRDFYENLSKVLGSDELASKKLNEYGIKGITYDGRQDGRCYVIFDDKAVNILETYYQEVQQENLFINSAAREKMSRVKGYYVPAENLISLFENADESTVVHEFAHWWLERLVKYSKDNEELSADVEAVREFLKNNGEPFTREQHEKFARGFEAYIRSGYAKNNRLKKIFEDFKNALLSIYDSIRNLGYKDDDLPQLQNLFDRLLTTEHERIKATVFDKIAEIDNQIEAIKQNEEKEFEELDKIYKDNIAILNRKSERKRTVQQYLELADAMTSRETKEVKEFKKRYKNATLDILSVVSGKSKAWVANPRNWEKLQDMVANADDKITTEGGLRAEWTEFYSDTGVTYENDEIDGDYKLAEQALRVLINNDYSKTFDENYQFADIDKFIAKFDYIAAKVKSVKGEEKAAAYEALATLFDNMPEMPDDIMSDLAQRLLKVGDEYEADQQKDFNRRTYPSIPVVQQLQYFVTKKLNDLKIYNPETRYKMRLNKSHRLYRYIKSVSSVNSAKKQIRRINEFVIDDMRNNQRSLLHKEIQKQIRINSKVVKVGAMKKGKFDWKTNTVFAELVDMNKLQQKEAEKELGIIVNIQNAEKGEARENFDENEVAEFHKTNDFQDNLKKKFLQYKSMRVQDLDVTHTIQLLQDILELKEKGRQAKSEEEFLNKTQKWNTKNNLLDILELTKNSGAKYGANWVAGVGRFTSLNGGVLANWESLLNAIFNKDIAQKYSLLKDEADAQVYARKHIVFFHKKAAAIYGFKEPNNWDKFIDYDYLQPLIKLFQEYEKEKHTYDQQVFSINSPNGVARSSIQISRAQMITMYAWSLNEKLEQRLFTQFGLEQIREMFENILSEQDKQLAWALVDTCEQMRNDINEVFIRTTGLSLPAVQNYFPSKAERVQSDIDMYHDFFVKSSNPSFIKERKVCNRIPMKPMSPLEILIPHINKTAKYVIMSEKVNFLNQIFKDTAIKTKMQEIWGSDNGSKIYQTLINKLAACTFTNYSKGTNLIAGWLDVLSRNYITSAIGFSPKVMLGQLLSVVNYAENMPAAEWNKGFIKTIKHPVKSFKFMLEHCEYLQARLGGNSQNEVIEILTSEKDRFRTLRNFMTSNTKWGDIIAITLGGKPYVDYLMSQGMNIEDAFDKFTEDTLRAQQSSSTSSISEWQSAQAKDSLNRMFFAFKNTTIQYERKFVDTLIQAKKGEISRGEVIKKLFIYKVLNPFLFTSFLQNLSVIALFRSIFAGDDPEDYIVSFLNSCVEAAALSGMGAYGFAGFIASAILESFIAVLDEDFKHFETAIPVYTDFNHEIQKFAKGDLEFADYVEAVAFGADIGIGLPGTKFVNAAWGLGDIVQGDALIGLSRMAGYGNYTATKAWTGEAPKKNKRK